MEECKKCNGDECCAGSEQYCQTEECCDPFICLCGSLEIKDDWGE